MDKKAFRIQIEVKIESALAEFGKNTDEKKFKKQVRKAAKILSDGFEFPQEPPAAKPAKLPEAKPSKKALDKKTAKATPEKDVKKAAIKKIAKKVKKAAKAVKPAEATGQ